MAPAREEQLSTLLIGRRVLYFPTVESTNTVAAEFSKDVANDGLVVLADQQEAGRGRFGRTWTARPGEGVLLSLLIFPPEPLRREPGILTAFAAVAVCETIYALTQLPTTIKWPNDVLLNGKKVCGVLVEQGKGTIIGIGLNVHTSAEVFSEQGLPDASSLAMFTSIQRSTSEVARTLIQHLDMTYDEIRRGFVTDLEARWRWQTGLLGTDVVVQTTADTYQGRLLDLTFSSVLLETAEGELRGIASQQIEHITPTCSYPRTKH
jgi:BirA family biotin operon repressor/biotin-[acetyl-CoA-carboxylase] ligase